MLSEDEWLEAEAALAQCREKEHEKNRKDAQVAKVRINKHAMNGIRNLS